MVIALLSVAEAAVSLLLSILVYRAGRGRFVNRAFSVALFFFAGWIGSSFVHEFAGRYDRGFLTAEFRICYTLIVLAAAALFLFALGFLKGSGPKGAWVPLVALTALAVAVANLGPWFLRGAEYEGMAYRQDVGPLYPLYLLVLALLCGGALLCMALKRRRSLSLDRARATYMLAGFGVYIPVTMILSGVLPGVMERDVTSTYGTLLSIFPLSVTTYALIKHRLLDVRIAVRRVLAYLFTVVLFGMPLLFGYGLVTAFLGGNRIMERALAVSCLGIAVVLSPAVLGWCRRFSSRLLFTDLYDEVELLDRTFREALAYADVREGVVAGMTRACHVLGLSRLEAVIPPEVTERGESWVMGVSSKGGQLVGYRRAVDHAAAPKTLAGGALIREDGMEGVEDAETERLLQEMRAEKVVAFFPLRSPGGGMGWLLVGEKENRAALNPLDLDFLEEFASRLGLLLENYLLVLRLTSQLEEVDRVREELERSEAFKTEIIEISARELRAPIESLGKMTDGVFLQWEKMEDGEKKCLLDRLVEEVEGVDLLVGELLISPLLAGEELRPKEQDPRRQARRGETYPPDVGSPLSPRWTGD